MIGILLYETFDLVYSISKLTYNGARGAYYWYYGMDYPEEEKIKQKDKLIAELAERVKHLEEINHVDDSSESVA